jgi:hypothetical protein
LATAEGRIGTATRIAPSTPIPKHLQGRPLRVAADVKNSASIKLNGESVRVDIPETSKIESSLVVQNAELEEQHKSEAAALVIIDKPEPSIFEEDEIHERTLDKMEAIKSHEWSARVQSYLDLSEILFSKDDPSIDQELTDKIMNVFVQSLADNHFRVVKIGLDVWNRLLDERNRNTENHLVTLLPLVLTVSEDPQLRSKQEIRISTVELVEKIQKYMDPVEFINVLFYTLNAPEYSKNCRVRHGAINLLHSMIPKFKRDFFNKLTGKDVELFSQ